MNEQHNSYDYQNLTLKYNEEFYGLTYGEWTAKWWKWAYSIPSNVHPAYDNNGEYCGQNQTGPVWFLAGSFGFPVKRQCVITAETAILFPILNSECSYAEYSTLKTERDLRECAKNIQDQVVNVKASVNATKLQNLEKFRIQSHIFNFTLPKNNILGLPPQNTQAVSDGNWVFLKPLPVGKYEIRFRGEINQSSSTNNNLFAGPVGWDYETIYLITINPTKNIITQSNTELIDERDIKNHLIKILNANSSQTYIRLTDSQINDALKKLPEWSAKDNKLHKIFKFKDFASMFAFMFQVAEVSQKINHAPNMTTTYTTVTLEVDTWNLGHVISNYDIKFANHIEQIYQKVAK